MRTMISAFQCCCNQSLQLPRSRLARLSVDCNERTTKQLKVIDWLFLTLLPPIVYYYNHASAAERSDLVIYYVVLENNSQFVHAIIIIEEYRIAGNFQRKKFSRIGKRDHFVEC